MRRLSAFTSLIFLTSVLALPEVGAAVIKSGAVCVKVGTTSTNADMKFTCIKSGKKLIWSKGILLARTPTTPSFPTQVPTSTISPRIYYVAKDQKTVHHLVANEGCANPSTAQVEIQALQGDIWLPVKPINSGWQANPQSCPVAQLGKMDSLAWADVYLDPGTTFRWYFQKGEVNIRSHDNLGNGISENSSLPPILIPHSVEGGYGITWDNVSSKFNDIAAAAWTDSQITILRNKNLPNASSNYKSYFSPGSLINDPEIKVIDTYLNRAFFLFARIPSPKNVFLVATTASERIETLKMMDSLYADNEWMKSSLNSIYGINSNLPAGSELVFTKCVANDKARNASTYPDSTKAGSLTIDVCPAIDGHSPHNGATHGMAHEYTHLIQAAILGDVRNRNKVEPCWLREGAPEWVQVAISNNFNEYLASKNLHPIYRSGDGLRLVQTPPRAWKADEVASILTRASDPATCDSTDEFSLNFSLGAALIETLVAIGGSESFFSLEERMSNGEALNEAFTEIYGQSWDKSLPTLSEVVARQISKSWESDALTYQTRPKS